MRTRPWRVLRNRRTHTEEFAAIPLPFALWKRLSTPRPTVWCWCSTVAGSPVFAVVLTKCLSTCARPQPSVARFLRWFPSFAGTLQQRILLNYSQHAAGIDQVGNNGVLVGGSERNEDEQTTIGARRARRKSHTHVNFESFAIFKTVWIHYLTFSYFRTTNELFVRGW